MALIVFEKEEDWLCVGEKRRHKDNLLIPLSHQVKSSDGCPAEVLTGLSLSFPKSYICILILQLF